jgi:hypothetical protein
LTEEELSDLRHRCEARARADRAGDEAQAKANRHAAEAADRATE